MKSLLSVKDLKIHFYTKQGIIHAVNGISFDLNESETVGIVGESGCGKSVSMLSLLNLIDSPPGKITNGQAFYLGNDLLKMSGNQIREIRGAEIGMVFQDPMTSFDPVLTLGQQMIEPLEAHKGLNRKQSLEKVTWMLTKVGFPYPEERIYDYPHQFSGGMRQRAMIAMALLCNPKILIADEPTTALDVTIQAQIIELIIQLQKEMGMAIIWITHDLGIIAKLAKRVMVMYGGLIIEESPTINLYYHPLHPYTIGLLGSLPRVDITESQRLTPIKGAPPIILQEPNYCPFAPRCDYVIEHCKYERPSLRIVENDHKVACWIDIDSRKAIQ